MVKFNDDTVDPKVSIGYNETPQLNGIPSPSMAAPDLDDGFVQIANELLPVLMTSFGRVEGLIVSLVLVQQYGRSKPGHATLSIPEIERQFGLPHGNGYRALRKLLEAKVLAKVGSSGVAFKFNKYHADWVLPAPTREWLDGPIGAAIAWVRERFRLRKRQSNPTTLVAPKPHNRGESVASKPHIGGECVSSVTQANDDLWGANIGSAGARAPGDLEIGDKRAQSALAADSPEPFEAPNPNFPPEVTGPGPNDPEARRLIEWAATLGPDYAGWVSGVISHAPVAWLRAILERKVVSEGKRPGVPFLARILADWRRAGRPEWSLEPNSRTKSEPKVEYETYVRRPKRPQP